MAKAQLTGLHVFFHCLCTNFAFEPFQDPDLRGALALRALLRGDLPDCRLRPRGGDVGRRGRDHRHRLAA